MTRRAIGLILILILSVLVAPHVADGQPGRNIPIIGVLRPGYASADARPESGYSVFLEALRDLGYIEGQTMHLEYRSAEWQLDRLSSLAAELLQLKPDVLVTNTMPADLAAMQATAAIPIVLAVAGDLVEDGLVASLERPGGSITGQILRDLEPAGNCVEFLEEAVPHIVHMAVLADPNNPSSRQIPRASRRRRGR